MKKEIKQNSAILPMPVILIATYNEDGTVDVMNAAWGCAYDTKQVLLNISETHQTTRNIRRTGAFTVTFGTADHVEESDYVGLVSASRVKDKFARTGLKAHKSDLIDAPILDDFPICLECKPLPYNGEYGVLGDVIRLSVDEEFIDDKGNVDLEKMKILAFDPINHNYHIIGKKVGQAFSAGKKYTK